MYLCCRSSLSIVYFLAHHVCVRQIANKYPRIKFTCSQRQETLITQEQQKEEDALFSPLFFFLLKGLALCYFLVRRNHYICHKENSPQSSPQTHKCLESCLFLEKKKKNALLNLIMTSVSFFCYCSHVRCLLCLSLILMVNLGAGKNPESSKFSPI